MLLKHAVLTWTNNHWSFTRCSASTSKRTAFLIYKNVYNALVRKIVHWIFTHLQQLSYHLLFEFKCRSLSHIFITYEIIPWRWQQLILIDKIRIACLNNCVDLVESLALYNINWTFKNTTYFIRRTTNQKFH